MIYLPEYFLSLLNLRNSITQQSFARAMQRKEFDFFLVSFKKNSLNSLIFLVSLKYKEIIRFKTVTLYKKLYFIKSFKSIKKKLALTSFYNVS